MTSIIIQIIFHLFVVFFIAIVTMIGIFGIGAITEDVRKFKK